MKAENMAREIWVAIGAIYTLASIGDDWSNKTLETIREDQFWDYAKAEHMAWFIVHGHMRINSEKMCRELMLPLWKLVLDEETPNV